jgi:hypothetical protein
VNRVQTAISKHAALLVGLALTCVVLVPFLWRVDADSMPQVKLNADSIAPRPIEELTEANVIRDYAYAWRELGQALDQNRSDALNAHFTGFAKDRFSRRIADQKKADIRVRYLDHGHQVRAFFYSDDGSTMQLLDTAKLEIQTLDGGKVVDQENVSQQYLVLMTPGSDRWYVRSLDPISGSEF